MAKDTFYFSHDYNSRNDSKIKKLLAKYGYEGYGLFWAIIEDLYNNTNVLRLDYDTISFDLRTTPEIIKSIINDFDLFEIDKDSFGSLSVQRRLNERNEKSKKARESILSRWNNKKEDTNVLQTNNDCNTIKERKGKENKDNKIDFDIFWNLYNKKEGSKNDCEKKWNKLKIEEQEKIIKTLPSFISKISEKKFQPFPATYLNQKRWNDEIEVGKSKYRLRGHMGEIDFEGTELELAEKTKTGYWTNVTK